MNHDGKRLNLVRNTLLISLALGLSGCGGVDGLFNGSSYRKKIYSLNTQKADLTLANQKAQKQNEALSNRNVALENEALRLGREVQVLRYGNADLAEQQRAFRSLLATLENNPCFDVTRGSNYSVSIQPIYNEECVQ
ncbi:hypothetical protein EOI86_06690 [Hwanghaeella grinnelliae]|uniref:Uncharacterized protein n=1 Tax=Hwanghaeella grinnelliae TaxID=2500179 RepID=A0A3S2VSR8_9PROT|nr:hypothetical protein [Hwanghaeella grinnelliae]RVU38946.1 hypothetical protein EOI86_06690 [Hwanghaeella grinnelliae]